MAVTEFFRNFWAQERGTKVHVLGMMVLRDVGGALCFGASGGCWGLEGGRERTGAMNSGSRATAVARCPDAGMPSSHPCGGRGNEGCGGVWGAAPGRLGPPAAWEFTLLPRDTEPGVGKQ